MTVYWHHANSEGLTEATAEIRLEKENFESYLDQSGQTVITHEQWQIVAEDIDGTLENSADEIMARIADLINLGVYFEGDSEGGENGN
jgi:hypothetical protein